MNLIRRVWLASSCVFLTKLVFTDGNNKGNTLSSQSGRYVFGQVSEMARDQYLLDTQTGRMWNIKQSTEGGEVLVPIMFTIPGSENYSNVPIAYMGLYKKNSNTSSEDLNSSPTIENQRRLPNN